MHPSCQIPVLSFVKQTGDVTEDDAGVEGNIPAEKTSEVDRYVCFTAGSGVILRNRVLEMTQGQASFSAVCVGPRTGLLKRLPVTLHKQTARKRHPHERETGPRTECLSPRFPHVKSGLGFCRRRLDSLVFKKIPKL